MLPCPNVPCSLTPPQSPATSPFCGVPTGASQPLRYCRPAVKYLTRLNRFTFVTARASLCLRLVRFVASRTQDSIPGEAAHLLSGREFHPLEAPGLSWRAVVKAEISELPSNSHGRFALAQELQTKPGF